MILTTSKILANNMVLHLISWVSLHQHEWLSQVLLFISNGRCFWTLNVLEICLLNYFLLFFKWRRIVALTLKPLWTKDFFNPCVSIISGIDYLLFIWKSLAWFTLYSNYMRLLLTILKCSVLDFLHLKEL